MYLLIFLCFYIKVKHFVFCFFFLSFKNVMLSLEDVIEHLKQVTELIKNVTEIFVDVQHYNM